MQFGILFKETQPGKIHEALSCDGALDMLAVATSQA